MSLLDDVSIVVTPNGYKAGELYAVVPVPTEGAEEVTDGDFPVGTTAWTEGAGWDISGGSANSDGSQSAASGFTQSSVFTSGKRYKLSFNITSNGADFKFWVNGTQNIFSTSLVDGLIEYTFIASATGSAYFEATSTFIGSISNVSVKEYTAADMDVTRATAATRVDENGLIEVVADNVPRIDYSGGGCPHILAEPMRTNLITYSRDFSNAAWSKTNLTVTADSITSPDGTINADEITANNATGNFSFSDNTSATSGQDYTQFIYAKSGTYNYLWIGDRGDSPIHSATFDILNGTILGSSNCTASIALIGGFYQCKITYTRTNTGTQSGQFSYGNSSHSTDRPNSLVLNGETMYVWGAQLEVGSYATSYIPTSGSTVTRNQDQFSRDGISSLINSEEGVLFLECSFSDISNSYISLNDGSTSSFCWVGVSGGGLYSQIRWGGVTRADMYVGGVVSVNQNIKCAIKYKDNDFSLWLNGSKVATDTSGDSFPSGTLNSLRFDNGASNPFYGKVKQLQVYKTALGGSPYDSVLSDARLAALTSL